jgi:hypothetical protein
MASSIPVPRSDNVNSTLPVPVSIYVWIEQAGVWFIENHKDVINVTERISRERRDETEMKHGCNAREMITSLQAQRSNPAPLGKDWIASLRSQ